MSTPVLSPLAQQLLDRLSAPKPDHDAFTGAQERPDITALSRDELGAIWGALDHAYYDEREHAEAPAGSARPRVFDNKPAYQTAVDLLVEMDEHQLWPRLTDDQAITYLERSQGQQRSWQRALGALAWRAEPQAPLPKRMIEELRRILGDIGPEMPGARHTGGVSEVGRTPTYSLCIARHLQPDGGGPEVEALTEVLRQSCPEGRYARKRLELLLSHTREELRAQSWPDYSFDYLRDARYRRLDEEILADAAAHLESIHRGDVPYVGYKAFEEADVNAIVSAFRRAAQRNEPWLAAVAHRLQTLSCYAPDRQSKSMPSQTLACRIAEEISLLPTPATIESVNEAAGSAINATVKKTLQLRLKQAKTALALRPEVVLAMAATGEPTKKQQTLLATLLQASYWTNLDFSLADWRSQLLLSPGGGEFTQRLIWLAKPVADGAPVAFMASETDAGSTLTDAAGAPLQVPEDARIRLWHPLHATPAERDAWQRHVRARHLRQPLRQAFREYYEPVPDDLERPTREVNPLWAPNRTERFADFRLSLKPLIGLARAEGWKIEGGRDHGLTRQFGLVNAVFEVADELHPGVDGDSESVALSFWRGGAQRPARVPIPQVPPVVYSEACRAADLLVSVCSYAYTADDPHGPLTIGEAGIQLFADKTPPASGPMHPKLKREWRLRQLGTRNIADMAAMRRRVLMQAFTSDLESGRMTFGPRSAQLGEYLVNLATGGVSRNGEQVEVKLPKPGARGSKLAAVPWLPYDEALLEKLVATIALLLQL